MSKRLSIGESLTLLVTCFAVPLTLLLVASLRDYRETFLEGERHARRTVQLLHEQAARSFATHQFILDELDDRLRDLTWDDIARSETVHRMLKRVDEAFDSVDSIWLTAPDGHSVNSSVIFPLPDISVADRDYFKAVRERDALFVSEAYEGRITHVPAFNLARRRTAPDGRFDGAITLSVHIDAHAAAFARALSASGDVAGLIRADGTILVRRPSFSSPGSVRLGPDNPLLKAMTIRPESGLIRTRSELDGVERFFAYRRLGDLPIYVTYGHPVAAVQAQWLSHVAIYALVAVPSSFLLAFLARIAMRKSRSERRAVAQLQEEVVRRERAEEILQKIQRLEMLGQITGGIAHDFNNLLMVITSNLYLAQARAGADSPCNPFIDTAMQAAYRGGQLTQQLLSFARQQTLKPEVVNLTETLSTMADSMLKRSLRGDIAVETDFASGLWPVEVDRAQLELAVLNLAVNARDAMPTGGTLRVVTRNVEFACNDGPDGLDGAFVALTLADTGTGIDPAIRDRVFDPFFTTKEVGKGTGLGLSQVYGFASQSGGTAVIEGEPGAGAAITLYLPRSRHAPNLATGDIPPPIPAGHGRAVLLVEDSPEIGKTTTTLLQGFGYAVTLAENADRALECLSNGKRFDLVFSDIVMPGSMNGLELARTIRRRFPDLPVLLTTGYSNGAGKAREEGFQLLHKPYRPEALARAMRDLLRVEA
ncbi:hybrid sensor histidine kinase/response regulator [Azospirillum soli]|uniref:hybrid sensor histidine kinase/response regulator n=1 Tax=Azospirillum soli TaxID=1304799 RepID=UPI001AE70F71|nr:hybrid sensor histidine kinase/response regulator [Azospirillum soli]MBP2312596.1 two-component system NtrC family sensor kinase [Azospirillum soli]